MMWMRSQMRTTLRGGLVRELQLEEAALEQAGC